MNTIFSNGANARWKPLWGLGVLTILVCVLFGSYTPCQSASRKKAESNRLRAIRVQLGSGRTIEGNLVTKFLLIRTPDGLEKVKTKDILSLELLELRAQPVKGKTPKVRNRAEELLKTDVDISCLGMSLKELIEGRGKRFKDYFEAETDRPGNTNFSGIRVPVPRRLQARVGERAGGGIFIQAYKGTIWKIVVGNYFRGRIIGLPVKIGDKIKDLDNAYGDRLVQHSRDTCAVRTDKLSILFDDEWTTFRSSVERAKKRLREKRISPKEARKLREAIRKSEHPELERIVGITVMRSEFGPYGGGRRGHKIVIPVPR